MKKRSSDAVEYLKEEFELEDKMWKDEIEFKKNESNAQAAIRVNEDSKSTESASNGFTGQKASFTKWLYTRNLLMILQIYFKACCILGEY